MLFKSAKKAEVSDAYEIFREVIRGMVEANKHTPDISDLDSKEYVFLLAIDSTQQSMPRHELISEGAYCGDVFTSKNFQFFKSKVEPKSIPIPMETELMEPLVQYMPPPAKIKGELHLITPHQFKKLDIEMENGVKFIRKRVRVLYPYRELRSFPTLDTTGRELPLPLMGKEDRTFLTEEKVHILRAHMYIGNPEYWDPLLDAGYHFTSVKCFEPKNRDWLKRYYKYTKHELK